MWCVLLWEFGGLVLEELHSELLLEFTTFSLLIKKANIMNCRDLKAIVDPLKTTTDWLSSPGIMYFA